MVPSTYVLVLDRVWESDNIDIAHPATRRSLGALEYFYLLGVLTKWERNKKKIITVLTIPINFSYVIRANYIYLYYNNIIMSLTLPLFYHGLRKKC